MGERLEKEAEAIWRAKTEQIPEWQQAQRQRSFDGINTVAAVFEFIAATHDVLIHIAREVDDPV